MYNNKNITGKTKIIDPNKDRVWIFESEHLLLTLNCDPYAIGKDHIFERLNPLKKKLSLRSSSIHTW